MFKPDFFHSNQIQAIQTTRIGGNSKPPYAAMNLGVFGEDPEALINVNALAKHTPHSPVFMKQVHGNRVVEYKSKPAKHGEIEADACFTREKGIVCAVLSADCLPVLITDNENTVVAAVHCGWKGLHLNLLKKKLRKLDLILIKLIEKILLIMLIV